MRSARATPALLCLVLTACSEEPPDTYLRLCLAASIQELQRASCRCMSKEYAAVLDDEEYAAIVVLMEKAQPSLTDEAASGAPGTAYVEPTPEESEVLMRALRKMEPLHRAGTCGYGQAAGG
jgi:hypothetical protein